MEDGEERTEGIFYSAIAYEKLRYARGPKPPPTQIVYPANKPSNGVPRYPPLVTALAGGDKDRQITQ
jgi:hypothetical protein